MGGPGLQKKFFGPSFGPQFHLKIRGGGPPPLDPPMLFKTGTSGTGTSYRESNKGIKEMHGSIS